MIDYEFIIGLKDLIRGGFDKAPEEVRERVMELYTPFYVRDGFLYDDGSRGSVRMTTGELRDLITYLLQEKQ
jgi:hypothetical protein